jgi:CO/xanthine dehydrogenase FAD-binding subunit
MYTMRPAELLPMMRLRLATPAALVDLCRIPGLDGISANGGAVTIRALATHAEVAGSEVAIGIAPVLPETAAMIGDRQVRNCGTLGGSVAHADPAADYPTVLKARSAPRSRSPGRTASARSQPTTSSAASSRRRWSRASSSRR